VLRVEAAQHVRRQVHLLVLHTPAGSSSSGNKAKQQF
jgi:hypothetical protein